MPASRHRASSSARAIRGPAYQGSQSARFAILSSDLAWQEGERVWIIVNREKFRSRKKNIRWKYPGAREELFLRENCQLKFRSYLWSVFLWDRSAGEMKAFRKESEAWVE